MAPRKAERLINLVICLLAARRFITRQEIRAGVEGYAAMTDTAFLRAFERDKEDLRRLGVPLEVGPTDAWSDEADGYRIRRSDFELPPLDLTGAESTLLGLAARVWQQAALADATSRALTKLHAAGVAVGTDRLVAVAPTLPTHEPGFSVIWQGWLTRRPVRFRYHGRVREVEPWKLALRQGRWYVLGRDQAVGPRWFKLSRIEDTPGLLADRPPFPTVSAAELEHHVRRLDGPEPTRLARLALRPDGAPGLRRRGRLMDESPGPPGYAVFAVPYARDDEIVAEAAAAGADALVLDPPDLRAHVVEHLTWVAARRTGPPPAPASPPAPDAPDARSVEAAAAAPTPSPPVAAAEPGPGAPCPDTAPLPRPTAPTAGLAAACDSPMPTSASGPSETVAASGSPGSTAADQVARLLLLIPYLLNRPGARLVDAARDFGTTPEQIRLDLGVAFLCGLPGGLPGDLIEVDLDLVDDEGVIYLTNADVLGRPLTLTADEAMGLIVALGAIGEVAAEPIHPVIDSLLAKLAALAPGAPDAPALAVPAGTAAVREALGRAISQAERVELTYDGPARGATTRPTVDPARLFVADGVGYLSAWSLSRGDWRTYRLDRISAVCPTGQMAVDHGPEREADSWLRTLATARPVRLLVHPGAAWIAEYFPVSQCVPLPGGDAELTVPVADAGWLRWLLLRLGPAVEAVDAPDVEAAAAAAARRALDAYRAAGLA